MTPAERRRRNADRMRRIREHEGITVRPWHDPYAGPPLVTSPIVRDFLEHGGWTIERRARCDG